MTRTCPRRDLRTSLLHPVWSTLGSMGRVARSLRCSLCYMNQLLSQYPVSTCCMVHGVPLLGTFSGVLSSQTSLQRAHMAPPCYLALCSYFNRADWRSTHEHRDTQTLPDAAGSAQQSWLHLSLLGLPLDSRSPPFSFSLFCHPHGSGPWINILPMNTTIHYPPDN